MMAELAKYRDYPIYGYFVVTAPNDIGERMPLFVAPTEQAMRDWLLEFDDWQAAGRYRVHIVSGEDGEQRDITEDMAGDIAQAWADDGNISVGETDWTDFPAFAAAYADDAISDLLQAAQEADDAARDERASFYCHANRGTW